MWLRRSRHRRRPPIEWGPYQPMQEQFLARRRQMEWASTEEAQAWFDELMAGKDARIVQVRALLERNGVDTSDPAAPGFWRDVTHWLDQHAEYDAEQAKRSGRREVGAGFPFIWKAVCADIDLWLVNELVRRSGGVFKWWLPLEDPEDLMFQDACFRHGMHGRAVNALGRSINSAYSDYRGPRHPAFPADLGVWLDRLWRNRFPGRRRGVRLRWTTIPMSTTSSRTPTSGERWTCEDGWLRAVGAGAYSADPRWLAQVTCDSGPRTRGR